MADPTQLTVTSKVDSTVHVQPNAILIQAKIKLIQQKVHNLIQRKKPQQ